MSLEKKGEKCCRFFLLRQNKNLLIWFICSDIFHTEMFSCPSVLGPVVRKPINANPRL